MLLGYQYVVWVAYVNDISKFFAMLFWSYFDLGNLLNQSSMIKVKYAFAIFPVGFLYFSLLLCENLFILEANAPLSSYAIFSLHRAKITLLLSYFEIFLF